MEPRDALSIPEFCVRHGLSRASLYNLWAKGEGPRRMKVGARTLISREAAEAWRRQCEEEPVAKEPEAA